jgi:quinol monooxygenase YgiN
MIAVILEFEPIAEKEAEFVLAWRQCTQVIYENFGSLGSRLHKSQDGRFIAYAQWPNEDAYNKSSDWPEHLIFARDRMRALLKGGKPKLLHKLTVEADLLKTHPHCQ